MNGECGSNVNRKRLAVTATIVVLLSLFWRAEITAVRDFKMDRCHELVPELLDRSAVFGYGLGILSLLTAVFAMASDHRVGLPRIRVPALGMDLLTRLRKPPIARPRLSDDARTWDLRFMCVVLVLLLVRAVYVFYVPLDLAPDEAYYWDWSRQLDWGYYSKPPMVAWLIWLSTSLGGSSEFFVRLPAATLGTVGTAGLYLLGRRMFSARVGFWTAILAVATPGNVVMSLLMTIDAPLMFCWCLGLYCVWRMLEQPQLTRWTGAAIIVCGLGFLSKQTMLGILPLTWLFVLLSSRDRFQLRRPSLWLWSLGSLCFLIPVVIWNVQHDWITLEHTGDHFRGNSVSWGRRIVRALEFSGAQLGVLSPVTCLLMIVPAFGLKTAWKTQDRRALFLLTLSVVPLIAVFLLSFTQRVQPNWPAPFVPAGIVFIAAWACGEVRADYGFEKYRSWRKLAVVCGVACCLVTYLLPIVLSAQSLAGAPVDVTVRLRGWQRLGQVVSSVVADHHVTDDVPVIAATSRIPVSPLAFYMDGQPRVFRWNSSGMVQCQYDIWSGPDLSARRAVIITPGGVMPPAALARNWPSVKLIADVSVPIGEERKHSYAVWIAERPANSLRSAWVSPELRPAARNLHGPSHRPVHSETQ